MTKRTRALLGSLAAAAMISFAPVTATADGYWQCVPFARLMSGIQIFGDARTWWGQAADSTDRIAALIEAAAGGGNPSSSTDASKQNAPR